MAARKLTTTSAAGEDWLAGQEAAQVLGQLAGAGVAAPGLAGHRLEDHRLQVARDPRIEASR
jgi:hypothetical protein